MTKFSATPDWRNHDHKPRHHNISPDTQAQTQHTRENGYHSAPPVQLRPSHVYDKDTIHIYTHTPSIHHALLRLRGKRRVLHRERLGVELVRNGWDGAIRTAHGHAGGGDFGGGCGGDEADREEDEGGGDLHSKEGGVSGVFFMARGREGEDVAYVWFGFCGWFGRFRGLQVR